MASVTALGWLWLGGSGERAYGVTGFQIRRRVASAADERRYCKEVQVPLILVSGEI